MALNSLSQIQSSKQIQTQTQRMSARQIQTVKMISLNSIDLRDEIFKELEKNPALEIKYDPLSSKNLKSRTYKSGTKEDSDRYNSFLENQEDETETLQQHLLTQLNMTRISPETALICKQIIENLDDKGFYFLSPYSLKYSEGEKKGKLIPPEKLEKAIGIIREFDPAGICCTNFTESLKIQAELKFKEQEKTPDWNKLIMFFLNNRLEFLESGDFNRIQDKILDWLKIQKKASIKNNDQNTIQTYEDFDAKYVTTERISQALSFIRTLNPNPAGKFTPSKQTNFISPDVEVTVENGFLISDEPENGKFQLSNEQFLQVTAKKDILPEVVISEEFKKNAEASGKKELLDEIKNGRQFISTLQFRNKSVFEILVKAISLQKEYFVYGQGNLNPLTQKELAKMLKISESTVSRMADSKYIYCQWGTIPFKNLFSHSLNKDTSVSSEKIKSLIKKLVQENKEQKLNDQKIADLLGEMGIKIARRTVSKYREQIGLKSSFYR